MPDSLPIDATEQSFEWAFATDQVSRDPAKLEGVAHYRWAFSADNTYTIIFTIWDSSDSIETSTILFDNWKWMH